jgi:hypothetical protein
LGEEEPPKGGTGGKKVKIKVKKAKKVKVKKDEAFLNLSKKVFTRLFFEACRPFFKGQQNKVTFKKRR